MTGDMKDDYERQSEPEGGDASAPDQADPVRSPPDSAGADRARRVWLPDWWSEAFAPTARVIANLQWQFASNQHVMQSLYDSTRFVDRIMPQLVKPLELAATVQLAQLVSGSSALFTVRAALAADFRLVETLKHMQIPAMQLSALTEASRAIAAISEAFLSRTRLYPDVDRAIAHVVAGWRVAAAIPRVLPPTDLDRLTAAGATTLEIATAGSVIIGSPPPTYEGTPWEDAPSQLRDRMRAGLSDIDPGLTRKLDGVWDRVSAPGPDAASQAANSLIEVIDWFLRLTAPTSDVLVWHMESGGPASLVTGDGRPTRALRVNYVMMTAHRDAKPARRFISGLLDILEFLQGAKHGLEFDDVQAVKRLIPAVEALFTYILI